MSKLDELQKHRIKLKNQPKILTSEVEKLRLKIVLRNPRIQHVRARASRSFKRKQAKICFEKEEEITDPIVTLTNKGYVFQRIVRNLSQVIRK